MSSVWKWTPLGEVIYERQETPDPNSVVAGDVRVISKISFNTGLIDFRSDGKTRTKMILIRPGDLVVSGINAAKGAIAVYSEEENVCSAATIHYAAYCIKSDKADRSFLWWLLRSHQFREILVESLPGGIKTELRSSRLLPIRIPLPPLEEQRRIVARIKSLAAKIEEANGLRKRAVLEVELILVSERSRVMQKSLVSGSIAITDAVELERGKFSYRPRNDPRFFGGKHPWIQIGEIESANKFILTWSDTLNDDGLSISRKFPKGTVLISIAATIGAVGILSFDCCIPDSIVAVTPHDGVDSEFVYHYLVYLRTHLEDVAPQSAQKNINLRILSGLPFPRLGLDEQRRIVDYLDGLQAKADHLKALQAQSTTELEALLPAVLAKAFRGELGGSEVPICS